ncbi:cupin [Bacillus sp. M6-12]|uniref:cupin domain-containing protein n=1 Tax=Bacillus sp. M6-12 TaxID=2054166 RepID=UPI000C77C2B0|nr:cupin domain-containing protein [Bacillus sp. M6-12]PLS18547.1 cupin [Bacillus sp. M6-12]
MQVSDELSEFHKKLESENLGPLWSSIHQLNTIEPKAKPIPYLWKKELIQKNLEIAEDLLEVGNGADRRAVFLINPGMRDLNPHGWGGATQTLYAAVQAVKPGEIAPSHRHTTTAIRFIMQGEGAEGRVNGEKNKFEPGDYLITPTWTWHDHTNNGQETVLWMDCLDVPFTLFMNVCFTEFYPEKQQVLTVPDNYSSKRFNGGMVRPINQRKPSIAPLGRYKWEQTKKSLDGLSELEPDSSDGYAVEYINPTTGKDANNRIGARMQKLPPKFHGIAHRHVHSSVYHAFKGKGYTIMNGVRFDWSEGDFFAVPSWTWHEHVNISESEDAILFSTNDLPIMDAFDFEREEEYSANNGFQEVTEVFKPLL